MRNRKISIILPVLNERLIFRDIRKIENTFSELKQSCEIICVWDEKLKNQFKKSKLAHLPHVKSLFYPVSRFGKGFTLCYGFNQSRGSLIFLWEGNFSISSKTLLLYLNLMDLVGADIVIGSKRHPLSNVYYTPLRYFYSKLYQFLVKILFGLNVTDTQVGLKLYKRQVLNQVIPQIIIKNLAFDLEILVVANTLGFKKIIEAPISIKKHFSTKGVNLIIIYNLLKETMAIFYRKSFLKYYQEK